MRARRIALALATAVVALVVAEMTLRLAENRRTVLAAYRHLAGEEAFGAAVERLVAMRMPNRAGDPSGFELVLLLRESAGFSEIALSAFRGRARVLETDPAFEADLRRRGLEGTPWRQAFAISARDPHPNAAGHAVYAEALYSFLFGAR